MLILGVFLFLGKIILSEVYKPYVGNYERGIFMKFLRKLFKMIFGVFGEEVKDKYKEKLDKDTERTQSKFVKKRNEATKQIIDLVDDETVDKLMDFVEEKTKKKNK